MTEHTSNCASHSRFGVAGYGPCDCGAETERTKGHWYVVAMDNGLHYITSDFAASGDICDMYHKGLDGKFTGKDNAVADARDVCAAVNAFEGMDTIPECSVKELVKALASMIDANGELAEVASFEPAFAVSKEEFRAVVSDMGKASIYARKIYAKFKTRG